MVSNSGADSVDHHGDSVDGHGAQCQVDPVQHRCSGTGLQNGYRLLLYCSYQHIGHGYIGL